MLVVIVEDDPQMTDFLTKVLRAERHEVLRFTESITALNQIRTKISPDVMLIDHQLPGGPTGLTLAKQARLILPRCTIMLMSLYAERDDVRQAMHIDADDFIFKPIEPVALIQSVSDAVMRRSMRTYITQETERTLGPLQLDLSARQAHWYGQPIHLTPTEFSLLQHLTANPGTVMNPAHLYSLISGEHVPPSEARIKIKTHIANLKRKLPLRGGGDPLKILKGQGIRWVLPDDEHDE